MLWTGLNFDGFQLQDTITEISQPDLIIFGRIMHECVGSPLLFQINRFCVRKNELGSRTVAIVKSTRFNLQLDVLGCR